MILRLEDVTALDKKKKHTIEIVVDRVSIDAGERARLTDSVEAARARRRRLGASSRSRARRASAPTARRAPAPLRRRLARADAAVVLLQQPARHVRRLQRPRHAPGDGPRPDRPRPRPLDQRRRHRALGRSRRARPGWTANVAAAVSREFGIPLDKPWKNLTPRSARSSCTAPARSASRSPGRQARRRLVGDALRGRRQHDQEAPAGDHVRGDAAVVRPLLSRAACRACKGQRLRPESRAVLLAGKSLVEVTAMTVRRGSSTSRRSG